MKRKTHEEFVKKVYELVGDEYTVLEEYKTARIKIYIKHNVCGHVWKVKPHHFITSGSRCPNCNKYKIRTKEEFLQQLSELGNDEYELLTEYINSSTKIVLLHKPCGYKWETTATNFVSVGRRCPECTSYVRNKSTAYFKYQVYQMYKDEYEVLGEYINAKTDILIKHKCGHKYNIKPHDFLYGKNKCPKCTKGWDELRKTTSDYKREIYQLVGNTYELLDEYVNNRTKLRMLHKECNKISLICPHDFLAGARCLYCRNSKGEQRINNFLTNNNVKFISQYKFDDCRNKLPLPFDFAILDSQNNIKCLIEYDGRFHFEVVEGLTNEETFTQTKINDQIKNKYCKKNNIKLIRIPYWEFDNIEEILAKELQIKQTVHL